MEYHCNDCDMAVEALRCGKCHEELVHESITVDNKEIQVSTCPNDCGKVKSPQCCGKDMQVQ